MKILTATEDISANNRRDITDEPTPPGIKHGTHGEFALTPHKLVLPHFMEVLLCLKLSDGILTKFKRICDDSWFDSGN